MTTEHYVTPAGVYIGGFGDGALPPKGAVEVEEGPGHAAQLWLNGAWQAYIPTIADQDAQRHEAYIAEADPLFFKWQAGEATAEEWKAKRQEIRDRFPYPAE